MNVENQQNVLVKISAAIAELDTAIARTVLSDRKPNHWGTNTQGSVALRNALTVYRQNLITEAELPPQSPEFRQD